MLKKIILVSLLFFYQLSSIFSDELVKISRYIQPGNHAFNGTYWSIRIEEYSDIELTFILSGENNKENEFKILQQVDHKSNEIGYGTYIIKDGIIDSFKVIECNHKVAEILTDQKIKLYYTDQDLTHDYYLLFEKSKIKLWGHFSIFIGKERMANGVLVIIVQYNGFTTENVKIRKQPLIGNNTVKYIDKDKNKLDYVPKDTFVFVYARTKNKYKVGKWYNYWYLVRGINFSESAIDLVQTKYIWVFAELVRYEEMLNIETGESYYPTGFPYD